MVGILFTTVRWPKLSPGAKTFIEGNVNTQFLLQAFNVKLGLQYAEDTEDGLRERLENNQPLAAYQSYQALKQAGRSSCPSETVERPVGQALYRKWQL